MLISYNWLKEFIPNIKATPKEVAERLSVTLAEVESVTKKSGDHILEIENKALTHRPDCFSHLGIAREVAAALTLKFTGHKLLRPTLSQISKLGNILEVEVEDSKLCPRYTAAVLDNIKIEPSPNWLKTALERLGLRSINNVVDITNYVMLELGQPLHAFSVQKLKMKNLPRQQAGEKVKIGVRTANEGEQLTTLDGQKRNLSEGMLLITDNKVDKDPSFVQVDLTTKPIALAGIMGGAETEVDENTNSVVLESANFNMYSIRQTSNRLGLRTEASTRFEKGLDPNLTLSALSQAISLMSELAGAKLAGKIADVYPHRKNGKTITITPAQTSQFLGINLDTADIQSFLQRLQLQSTINYQSPTITVNIPTFRRDLNLPQDLYEEIARIYGYAKILPTLPKRSLTPAKPDQQVDFEKKIKQLFKEMSFHEVYTYSFVSENLSKNLPDGYLNIFTVKSPQPPLKLKNPLSPELTYLRQSLLPSLVEKKELNAKYFDQFGIFEIDRVVIPQIKTKLPDEPKHLAGILYDVNPKTNHLYLKTKGAIETLLSTLNLEAEYQQRTNNTVLVRINIVNKRKKSINLGYIHVIDSQTIGSELDLDLLFKHQKEEKTFQKISPHPTIKQDLSLVINQKIPVGDIIQTIKQSGGALLKKVELFDIYDDEKTLGKGKKSVAFHLTFQSPKRSLAEKDIQPLREKITKNLQQKFQAKIRI